MIPTLLYVFIGLLVAATIMVIIEKRDIPKDDDGDRFFFALILVLGCGAFWPVFGSAVAIMLLAEWVA